MSVVEALYSVSESQLDPLLDGQAFLLGANIINPEGPIDYREPSWLRSGRVAGQGTSVQSPEEAAWAVSYIKITPSKLRRLLLGGDNPLVYVHVTAYSSEMAD